MATYAWIITLLCVSSYAFATPPSQQDYGLCSQVYLMHQYCTSQTSPASTGVTHRPAAHPRVGKAGPRGLRGPPGLVNYTAIEERIAAMFSEHQSTSEAKFESWERRVNAELEDNNREIEKLRNDLDEKSEEIAEINKKLALFTTPNCRSASHDNAKIWDEAGGVFDILASSRIFEVFCDLTTDGGGWTVFQRRLDGSVDFYRTWEEYAEGFGKKSGEFWLGLENIYQLTQDGAYELRVDLTDWDGSTAYAKYGTFSISGRSDHYRLTVGQYSGNAGDSMTTYNNGNRFSAKDKDLDEWSDNCASRIGGAWWYRACGHSSLNGRYNDTARPESGVSWYHRRNRWHYSLKASEMKFRKK